jgi:hypothetical protein
MQMASARYGRPKGTGLDDRQRLASIAAALVANPKLKPTTAIRSLGVDDPSTIRRLRDKFNLEQRKLMAEARRASRSKAAAPQPEPAKADTLSGPSAQPSPGSTPQKSSSSQSLSIVPQSSLLVGCFDLGVCVVSTAVEGQTILAEYWLRSPAVSMALRGQLALNAVAVAIYTRSKGRMVRLNSLN